MKKEIKSLSEQNKIFNANFPVDLLLNTIESAVMVLNNNREVVYCNDALVDISDENKENLLGMRPGDIFHCIHSKENAKGCGTTDACKLCGALTSIVKGLSNEQNMNECRIITEQDSSRNIVKFGVESIPYNIDGDKFVIFILKDIKSGRVLDETFYQLIQNIKSGVVIYEEVDKGEDFTVQFMNGAAEKIENLDKNKVVGERVTQAFPGIKEFGLLEVFSNVWKTGVAQDFPMKFYGDHRITGWRENHVFKLPSNEIVTVYEDITEKKQAEEEINDAKNWLDLILKTVNTGIVIIDYDTHLIEDMNEAGQKMIGLPKDEIVGKSCHEFICQAECGMCPITDLGMNVDNSERVLKNKEGVIIPILKTVNIGIHHNKKYLVESFYDISIQKEYERKLEHISLVDELTQISNRRALTIDLEKAMDYCNYNHSQLAIIMIDIDFFKNYNDRYGHIRGDNCLYQIANIIKKNLKRPHDHVYRYGGEEFTVVLFDTDEEGTYLVAERLRQAVIEEKIIHEDSSVSDYVSISIGCSLVADSDKINIDNLINKADEKLYVAKKSGRNCVK